MRTDYLGNPVSTNADAALAAIDNFVDGFLGYEARAAEVIGAAEVHPDEVLLNAYAATLWLLLEAPEAVGGFGVSTDGWCRHGSAHAKVTADRRRMRVAPLTGSKIRSLVGSGPNTRSSSTPS